MTNTRLSSKSISILLWAVAVLTFGIGDTLTTMVILGQQNFMGETNPIVAAAVSQFGLVGFLGLKVLVMGVALLAGLYAYRANDRLLSVVIPLLLAIAGCYATVSNFRLLL